MQSNNFSFHRFLNESRALLRLSLPIIITQLATNAMGFVDTSMAGQASARDLAAIAVGTSLWLPASLLLRGILMMLTPVTAHHRGAKNQTGLSVDFGQTLWIALPLGYTAAMTDLMMPAMGARGFWVGIVTGLTLSAGFMVIRLIRKMRST